jgi:hypothetical protein
MKTREFIIPGFEFPVLVHHHEDWSGAIVIEWFDQEHHHVEIPAAILLYLSINETKKWVLAEVEAAIDKLKGDHHG